MTCLFQTLTDFGKDVHEPKTTHFQAESAFYPYLGVTFPGSAARCDKWMPSFSRRVR
jgi:hypothetical protein